ncbi:MAG: NFACT family protein [Bacilli bacterium]
MALDNLTIEIITRHLREQLVGSSFGKPLALTEFDYGFPYSEVMEDGSIKHGTFIFSMNPTGPFFTYSYDRYTKIDDTSPFFNSLKKMSMSTITSVKKLKGERIITISMSANSNDLSEINTGYDFVIELFPNRPNCYIIAYPYGRIVSLYRERTNIEKGLFVARNTIYSYPNEREVLPETLTDIEEARHYLNNSLYRHLKTYIDEGKSSLNEALANLHESDSLFFDGKEILPFDFGIPEIKKIKPEGIYSSLVADQKALAKQNKERALIALIEKAIKVSEKKNNNLKEDLQQARVNMVYLEYGQTIYLYQGEITKGDKLLEKDGYSIPLNPFLDGPNNANRYFKRYSKAKSAITILQELIIKSADETEYLKKKLTEAQDGTPRDIQELKSELLEQGYIKEKSVKGHINKVNKRKTYEPHYLILPTGKIGFGMNGLQNEELTFKIALKDSLFLHVKDYPGSHVVILDGSDDDETLLTACELALYLSHLSDGEIMVTEKRNVKKNPEKIGLVSILRYETIMIKNIRQESLSLFRKTLKG